MAVEADLALGHEAMIIFATAVRLAGPVDCILSHRDLYSASHYEEEVHVSIDITHFYRFLRPHFMNP